MVAAVFIYQIKTVSIFAMRHQQPGTCHLQPANCLAPKPA
jgi:hypothetical protein